MQPPAPDWESLGVAGALLSRYQQDQQSLLEQLATFLESTLPQQTSVRRTLGVLGPRRTTALSLELGGTRYELARAKSLEAQRTRVVRGVAVRSEPMRIEDWLTELSAALATELERTTGGRNALARLLQG
ncbi:MAG: hypothetical protein JO020_13565 [Chloroflexi bacterium]|nr:hypothetical protein [Chloroflexota bacterium]MBV9133199.1 hypothetical protein [Chloroflexota bacterium]MBV9895191.1 hypothetical protein [Chloroflexota bacterium]